VVQRKITTILPNSRFELIPDAGHVVYLERPDLFFGKLREFFARVSDRVDPNRVPPSRD
jgi:pimeloyl-ACP methyl ester carboxylesterase